MKTFTLTTLAAVLSVAAIGSAQANNSLSAKVMSDHPAVSAPGLTATPTARPDDQFSLRGKIVREFVGAAGGSTSQPLAKVDGGSIHEVIRQN